MSAKNLCQNANIEIKQSGRTLTLEIIGRFDSSTTPVIQQCCQQLKKTLSVDKVVLDFGRVTQVDTSAFACILGFMKEHLKAGVKIYVTHLKDPAKALLEVFKIEKVIPILE